MAIFVLVIKRRSCTYLLSYGDFDAIKILSKKKLQNNIPATNQEFVQKLFIVHWPPMKGVFFFQGESVHNWHQYISIIVHNG